MLWPTLVGVMVYRQAQGAKPTPTDWNLLFRVGIIIFMFIFVACWASWAGRSSGKEHGPDL